MTATVAIKRLWAEGFFKDSRAQGQIGIELHAVGCNPSRSALNKALNRADFLTRNGKRRQCMYVQQFPCQEDALTEEVLPQDLVKQMGRPFTPEISDLGLNYGKSGTCTAFMLRKILEKLILLAFAKVGKEGELSDPSGDLYGLERMIDICTKTKVKGKAVLTPRTAKEIGGIKFLGDVAAHNPFINVNMKEIVPQMPFITTAYSELANWL